MQGAGFFWGGGTGEGMRRSLRCLGRWGTRLRPGGRRKLRLGLPSLPGMPTATSGVFPGRVGGVLGRAQIATKGESSALSPQGIGATRFAPCCPRTCIRRTGIVMALGVP